MPNIGKKIPSEVVKDQATRQAFDAVEKRLKVLEANSNTPVSAEAAITRTVASAGLNTGLIAALTIETYGKPVEFCMRASVEPPAGFSGVIGRTFLRADTIVGGFYSASALLYLVRDKQTVVRADRLKFSIASATAGGAFLYLGSEVFRFRDDPPIGSHLYELTAYYEEGTAFQVDGNYKFCADTVK